MRPITATLRAIQLLILVLIGGVTTPADSDTKAAKDGSRDNPKPVMEGSALIKALRSGGYVLFFRHTATDHDQTDKSTTRDLGPCSDQRNLSEKGREQARAIGNAFKTLEIPVGEVRTSPYCRCVETGMLAFGKAVPVEYLFFSIGAEVGERKRLGEELRKALGAIPEAGKNTILISHTANLKEAAGVWPKEEGVAHIFKPEGKSGFSYMGGILVEQWTAAAAESQGQKKGS